MRTAELLNSCIEFKIFLYEKREEHALRICSFFSQNTVFEVPKKMLHLFENASEAKLRFIT